MIDIFLVVEDFLSESVASKLLLESERYNIITSMVRHGNGNIKKNMEGYNKTAQWIPFFILIDQDQGCPIEKLTKWFPNQKSRYMIFRIAVMEIESWLLADRSAMSEFLSIDISLISQAPDLLPDPKESLITLTKRSRNRYLRERIVPKSGSTAKIGPDYNACLVEFVTNNWSLHRAIDHSPSLKSAFECINNFEI